MDEKEQADDFEDLMRIQERERPGDAGPWKWQLIAVLERIAIALEKGRG